MSTQRGTTQQVPCRCEIHFTGPLLETRQPRQSLSPSGSPGGLDGPVHTCVWVPRYLMFRVGRACLHFRHGHHIFHCNTHYLVPKQTKLVSGSSSLEMAAGRLYSFTQKLSKKLAPSPEKRHSSQTKLDTPSLQTMSGSNSTEGRTQRQPEQPTLKGPPSHSPEGHQVGLWNAWGQI